MGAPAGGEAASPGIGDRGRLGLSLSLACLSLLALAQPAPAAFHEILVREVYAAGAGNDSYVVLQAYSGGQHFVAGHSVAAYEADGDSIGGFTFSGGVANGQSQMTILVADTAYATTFPGGPAPDGTAAALNLDPAGGAVCWSGLDCVSWGSFGGLTSPPAGTPALPDGIPAGMALRRSIAPGCPTLLEFADDSNMSANDLFEATPNPRANSSPIVEVDCVAPNTTIGAKPPSRTSSTDAEFTFTATPAAGASFECKLDNATFALCTSPQAYASLDGDNGPAGTAHTFQVRAKNASGTDPSPAQHSWTVDTVAPTVTIESAPADPSSGASAAFAFKANEAVSGFQCSLAKGAASDSFSSCSSGKTYVTLEDGLHTFKVRATDLAGNQGAADAHAWTVDNSLADTTPPETTIKSSPADPSDSATAFFAYESNEPGSSFECKLDGAAFAACPAAGIAYPGLANGSHGFQVRATDESGNTDPSPAGFSWTVAVPDPIQPSPALEPQLARPAPETTITAKPGAVTRDRTPTFRFRSSLPGSSFACRVDRAGFRPCSSPFTTKPLGFGRHTVRVRASAGGVADPTPAASGFKVAKPKKRKAKPRRGRSR